MISDNRIRKMAQQVKLLESKRKETPIPQPDGRLDVVPDQRPNRKKRIIRPGEVLPQQSRGNVEHQEYDEQYHCRDSLARPQLSCQSESGRNFRCPADFWRRGQRVRPHHADRGRNCHRDPDQQEAHRTRRPKVQGR